MNQITKHDEFRAKVFAMEREMLKQPQAEIKVVHHFSPGLYARELHIPEDVFLTGAIHKFTNMNILSQGEISVLTENGIVRVQAPFTVVSPPGTKRIAYTHTDCVWTTFFPTDETDVEKIVAMFTTNDEQEYLTHNEMLLLKGE